MPKAKSGEKVGIDDVSIGSKKRVSASIYWTGTFNNYTEDELQKLLVVMEEKCERFCMQEEKVETPHLQLKIQFKTKNRPVECFKQPKIHWEKSKMWAGWEYCCKADSRVGRQWFKGCRQPREIKVIEPYGWQLEVVDIIKGEPDERTIHWFWEDKGNVGKTSLCKYLVVKHDALLVNGKTADMMYAVASVKEKPDICILDVPRYQKNNVSYIGLECIKNGIFFNGKYESGMVKIPSPHVLVFANYPPILENLSSDRWHVVHIETNDTYGGDPQTPPPITLGESTSSGEAPLVP